MASFMKIEEVKSYCIAYLGKHIFNILLKDNTCVIKVICTLDSIDSIKSLKRSPQHIFVEVRVPGSEFRVPGFQVPESNFRVPSSGLRTLFHDTNKNHYSIQTENLSLLCICPQKDYKTRLNMNK
ncbi:hypothetical protein Avbf_17275, partial [Armadillidium vulgare]